MIYGLSGGAQRLRVRKECCMEAVSEESQPLTRDHTSSRASTSVVGVFRTALFVDTATDMASRLMVQKEDLPLQGWRGHKQMQYYYSVLESSPKQ
jgi:hypothetical protein